MLEKINFYKDLPLHKLPLTELLGGERYFMKFPNSWQILAVKVHHTSNSNSSSHFKQTHMLIGKITSVVLNQAIEADKDLEIPYILENTEVTFLMPFKLLVPVLKSLKFLADDTEKRSHLKIQAGSLSVKHIYNQKRYLKIAKFAANNDHAMPIILGNGLAYAKSKIKNELEVVHDFTTTATGKAIKEVQYRWHEISPNKISDNIISLRIACKKERSQAKIFRRIISEIDYVFGDLNHRNISNTCTLNLDGDDSEKGKNLNFKIRNQLYGIFGKYYFMLFPGGRTYLKKISSLFNIFQIDGCLSTVIVGNRNQINNLTTVLDNLESKKLISYAMQVSKGPLKVCYVKDATSNRLHLDNFMKGNSNKSDIYLVKEMEQTNLVVAS